MDYKEDNTQSNQCFIIYKNYHELFTILIKIAQNELYKIMKFLLLLILFFSFSAFSGVPSINSLEDITIISDVDSNKTSATSIDIVFIYDSSLYGILPLKSSDWFLEKEALITSVGDSFDILSLQIPPGAKLEAFEFPRRHKKAINIIFYSNFYSSSEQEAYSLINFKHAKVMLLEKNIKCIER